MTLLNVCWPFDVLIAVVTVTSFVTYSRPGGAPASQRSQWERGGVHQQREWRHARGEDPGGRARCWAQNRDVHRNQLGHAFKLSKWHHFLFALHRYPWVNAVVSKCFFCNSLRSCWTALPESRDVSLHWNDHWSHFQHCLNNESLRQFPGALRLPSASEESFLSQFFSLSFSP